MEYSSTKSLLITDKIIGTITICLGFVYETENSFYVPNTVLREDIRDVTKHPQNRILAIFEKGTWLYIIFLGDTLGTVTAKVMKNYKKLWQFTTLIAQRHTTK